MKIPLHCVGKKSFATFVHEKTDTFIGIISEETIALHGKDNLHHLHIPTRNWYIYWDENVSHCAPQGSPQCILTITLEIFYHLLYTKEYFITHTHISLKVPFSSLNFCLSNQEFGYLHNLTDKKSPQKTKTKLKTVINNLK